LTRTLILNPCNVCAWPDAKYALLKKPLKQVQ
jgi:hypothetical protein